MEKSPAIHSRSLYFTKLALKLNENYMACGSHETASDGIVVVCVSGRKGSNTFSEKAWVYRTATGELFVSFLLLEVE